MIEDKVALAVQTLSTLLGDGWSVAAIAKESGINQITLHNIKNRKATRITDKVYDKLDEFRRKAAAGEVQKSTRGRATAGAGRPAGKALVAKRPAATGQQSNSLINSNYVSVDITQLQTVVDRLIENFSDAITELQSVRSMLRR